MTAVWSPEELERIESAEELEIAARNRWVPIWVVRVGDEVFVRTWHRRVTGWYGRAVQAKRARIRVPGVEADVTVQAVGAMLQADIDAAYRTKYQRYGSSTVGQMVNAGAVATTLLLVPER